MPFRGLFSGGFVVQLKYNRGTVNISDLMIHGAPAFYGLRPDTCHLRR